MTLARFDVCVIGAGPAGSIAARELARAGASVAVVDNDRRSQSFTIGETVPGEARSVLARLGIARCLSSEEHLPSTGNASRWGSEIEQFRASILASHGPGWHLDRKRFDERLLSEARCVGAHFYTGKFEGATWSVGLGWSLRFKREDLGFELRAQYAIDSTGRAARLAMGKGARRRVYDKLVTVWVVLGEPSSCKLETEGQDLRTYIQATANGWWYSARLPERRRVLAFFTDGDLLEGGIAHSTAEFLARAAKVRHLREIAPWSHYRILMGPICVPAMSTQLEQAYGPAWIAAGDAAHSFDPLSSQGILSALIGGNNAAAALVAKHASDESILLEYQADLDRRYAIYLDDRREYYGAERRWTDSTFWRRRHLS